MKKLNWQDAVDFCKELEFAGHADWRLPSRKELESLVTNTQLAPALTENHPFLIEKSDYYWSSSTYADRTDRAWQIYTGNGGTDFSRVSLNLEVNEIENFVGHGYADMECLSTHPLKEDNVHYSKPSNPTAESIDSRRSLLDDMATALEGCPITSPAVLALLRRYYSGER